MSRWRALLMIGMLVSATTQQAQACSFPPDTRFASIEQIAASAPLVAVAVTGTYAGNGTHRFHVLDWLKGRESEQIEVKGFRNREGPQTSCDLEARSGETILLFLKPGATALQLIQGIETPGAMFFPVRLATAEAIEAVRRSLK